LAAVLLSGCSTAQIDSIPNDLGGLPAGAPARPTELPAFPEVHDMPPPRAAALLDAEQQKRLEADLIATRNRQPNQQKDIAREKAKAKAKAAARPEQDKSKRTKRKGESPQEQTAGQLGAGGRPDSGTPPWPLPPQSTGGSPRP
jgi:uncharacterized protein (DUF1800 family)